MAPDHSVSLDQWRRLVLDRARLDSPRTLDIPIADAHGMQLAEPLIAAVPAPAFAMSAMDGFAAKAADVRSVLTEHSTPEGPTLPVSGDVAAGTHMRGGVREGAAVRIMTGAPIPFDCDVVIPVELTDADPTSPHAPQSIRLAPEALADPDSVTRIGRHIRATGEEIPAGTVLAPAGTIVSAPLIGIALAVGVTSIRVRPKTRVAIVMTGDELVAEPPAAGAEGPGVPPGAVLESNGPMLAAAIQELGATASIHHVADSPAALAALAASIGPRHDLLVTTGGVGSGARDVVKAAFGAGRAEEPGLGCSQFAHVHMRPGGPQGVGRLEYAEGRPDGAGTPMVHLPGTPVGALVGFHLFIKPLLLGERAREPVEVPRSHVTFAHPGRARKPGSQISPVVLGVEAGALVAREVEGSRLRPFTTATALAIDSGGDHIRLEPLASGPNLGQPTTE